ncbi:GNAT family N-acetyltransferase [Streptomyces lavendulae]|uniref:GNAT family N-acetyltransferase n=1 Tax=Streptomyces lavendulae TaxID=1914 RepID=UPI00380FD601
MFPDPGRRVRALTALFEVQVDHARQHGTVLIAGQDQGVAVVLEPDYDPSAAETGALRRRMARVCAADASTALGYLDALEAGHPHRRPHHYLTLLAVRAALQGHGIGSALLSDLTGRWQAAQEPAYLEATTPAGRRLYRRHGFTDHGTLLHPLSGPAVHPMWRNPTT